MPVKSADWVYQEDDQGGFSSIDLLTPKGDVAGVVLSETDPVTGGISLSSGSRRINSFPQGKYAVLPDGQPYGVTRNVQECGTLIDIFRDYTKWATASGSPTLSNVSGIDSSGNPTGTDPISRTGMSTMLKVVPGSASDAIRMVPADFPDTLISGKLGVWVYVASQPGYQAGGTPAGSITIALSTDPSAAASAISFTFGVTQVREGWNFLKFVKTVNPTNSGTYSGTLGAPDAGNRDGHFFGITESTNANYAYSNIMTNAITYMSITLAGLSGATIYFDSAWTDFSSKPGVIWWVDGSSSDFSTLALPLFAQYGWVGVCSPPRRVSNPTYSMVTDWKNSPADSNHITHAITAYEAGWDVANHTMNHNALGGFTDSGQIYSEVNAAAQWYKAQGLRRGQEFYASPQSSSSRLSENVIKTNCGIKVQRHSRHQNTPITPWGIDNPHHLGSVDLGSTTLGIDTNGMVTYARMKSYVDMCVRYGDLGIMYWHFLTTVGDTGDGTSTSPGDGLSIALSNFSMLMAYVASLESAGTLTVFRGLSDFYYGEAE